MKSNWKPSNQYQKVTEANIRYYAKTASQYDSTESCVTDSGAQKMLEGDLGRIIELCNKNPSEIMALDACGGSGNISLKLLRRNVKVTICDVSPDLLAIFEAKSRQEGLSAHVVCSEIGEFLVNDPHEYDLIVFSSALHHLENIKEVLSLAYSRLGNHGFLYTVFDPTKRNNSIAEMLIWLDYITFKVAKQGRDLFPSIARRIRRTFSNKSQDKKELEIDDANVGVLAEYHVEEGIDDDELVKWLDSTGFDIVWHDRYAGARFPFFGLLLSLTQKKTSFKLLLKKP